MSTPCYICGGPIDEVRLDPRDHKTKPCYVCEGVITETIIDYEIDDESEIFDAVPLEVFLERFK